MADSGLKYNKISDLFLRDIQNGKYKPGKKLPSERELARQYKLAHMTVNKALNGLVSRGYLERRQGDGTYVSAGLPPKTACLVLDYMHDIHSIFPYKLQKALFETGYIVTVFDTKGISESREVLGAYLSNYPELLIIDGLYLFPFELLAKVPKTTRKVIFQRCETRPVFDASYVLVDMKECGYMAAKQLISSGSKKIVIVTEKRKLKYDQPSLFISGAIKALNEYKIKAPIIIEHEIYREQEDAEPVSEMKAKELLGNAERPDGIMAFADYELIPFINAADKLGLSIPEGLRLIGMYNTPWAEQYQLSSLDIQADLIIENIVDIIKSGKDKKVMVSPQIIFRESSPRLNNQQ